MPRVLHPSLRRPLHGRGGRRRLPRGDSPGAAVYGGRLGGRGARTAGEHGARGGRYAVRARRGSARPVARHRIRVGAAKGRLQPQRGRGRDRARLRQGRGVGGVVPRAARQIDRARPLRNGGRRGRGRGGDHRAVRSAVLRGGDRHPRRAADAASHRKRGRRRGLAKREAGQARHGLQSEARPQAAARGDGGGQRAGGADAAANQVAPRIGQDAASARGVARGVESAGTPAPNRVLRHIQHPGNELGGQHGGVRERTPQAGALSPLPNQRRQRRGRLRLDAGDAPAALPAVGPSP